jgi:hypothetical protein
VLLVLIGQQTVAALRATGVWSRRHAVVPAASPYARIESLLGAADTLGNAGVARDPFAFGRAPVAVASRPVAPRPKPAPPPPASPVLTAIIWSDANPSATIRWNSRDYPVQVNTLFDEFRVASIARDQVVLERGAETLVLRLPKKGD